MNIHGEEVIFLFFFYWIVYSNNEANLFRETSSWNNNRGYAMAEDKTREIELLDIAIN